MNWNEIVERVTPFVVKIETPQGHGTGFLCLYNDSKTFLGIATAAHVVAHAEKWQEPIRLSQLQSGSSVLLKEEDRIIYLDPRMDSAVVLTPLGLKLELPKELIPLRPIEDRLPTGTEVGWLGFPAIGPNTDTLCFFSGNISAWEGARARYLIDGVSINGVSGGPVLYSTPADGVQIVGAVTAYIVNRATGEALPGLSLAQDLSHFHAVATRIKSIDEAKKKQQAEQAAQAAQTQEANAPQAEKP